MKRDPNLPVVGESSLCLTCKHSRIVTVHAEPHPAQVHQFLQDNPGKEPPPHIYYVESYCTNCVFIGKLGGARQMGTVVECEEYSARDSI